MTVIVYRPNKNISIIL